jgi:hypothetical protein
MMTMFSHGTQEFSGISRAPLTKSTNPNNVDPQRVLHERQLVNDVLRSSGSDFVSLTHEGIHPECHTFITGAVTNDVQDSATETVLRVVESLEMADEQDIVRDGAGYVSTGNGPLASGQSSSSSTKMSVEDKIGAVESECCTDAAIREGSIDTMLSEDSPQVERDNASNADTPEGDGN